MARTHEEQLRFLARARAGCDVAEVSTKQALNLPLLGHVLGTWFMVNHEGLEAGKPKTVFAACSKEKLEATLRSLRS